MSSLVLEIYIYSGLHSLPVIRPTSQANNTENFYLSVVYWKFHGWQEISELTVISEFHDISWYKFPPQSKISKEWLSLLQSYKS